MANLLSQSGVADGLFSSLRQLFGPLRGGLAITVVAVSTVLAACTGIIGASVVTMGILAIPVMLKYHYQKELTVGTICAGGSLGILIPPSVMLVVMGSFAGLSVGKLFMAAIVPGMILAGLYVVFIGLVCWVRPKLGPAMSPEDRAAVPVRKRLTLGLINMVPPVILILGVLGSIFTGVATPTEASGVGAFLAFLMVIGYRKFSWQGLKDAVVATAKANAMVFLILIGATCFTTVLLGVGGGDVVASLILGLGLGKWGIFIMMMLIVFILGMFIDWIGITMITFPIFLPIASQLGFDPLWFVTMLAVNLQASFLTPPFGAALFYIKGVAPPSITTTHIYRGIVPFVILQLCGLLICVLNPWTALWLPKMMIGK